MITIVSVLIPGDVEALTNTHAVACPATIATVVAHNFQLHFSHASLVGLHSENFRYEHTNGMLIYANYIKFHLKSDTKQFIPQHFYATHVIVCVNLGHFSESKETLGPSHWWGMVPEQVRWLLIIGASMKSGCFWVVDLLNSSGLSSTSESKTSKYFGYFLNRWNIFRWWIHLGILKIDIQVAEVKKHPTKPWGPWSLESPPFLSINHSKHTYTYITKETSQPKNTTTKNSMQAEQISILKFNHIHLTCYH